MQTPVEDIDHSRTKTKSPQTNGICERFHKTALNEFYRVAFVQLTSLLLQQAGTTAIQPEAPIPWLPRRSIVRQCAGKRQGWSRFGNLVTRISARVRLSALYLMWPSVQPLQEALLLAKQSISILLRRHEPPRKPAGEVSASAVQKQAFSRE